MFTRSKGVGVLFDVLCAGSGRLHTRSTGNGVRFEVPRARAGSEMSISGSDVKTSIETDCISVTLTAVGEAASAAFWKALRRLFFQLAVAFSASVLGRLSFGL